MSAAKSAEDQRKAHLLSVTAASEALLRGLSPARATTVCLTLDKVLTRILENPSDASKRCLRVSNKAVQKQVLAFAGAQEFLLSCRFEEQLPDAGGTDHALVLEDLSYEPMRLASRLQWLREFAAAAAICEPKQRFVADCLVKLLLPEGKALLLGFRRSTKLLALHQIVKDVLWPSFGFSLCQRHPKRTLSDADSLGSTMQEMGLVPNAVLAVDPLVKQGQAFVEAPRSAQSISPKSAAKASGAETTQQTHARSAKAKHRADKAHREQVLLQFQQDRERMQNKAAREKRLREVRAEQARKHEEALAAQRARDLARAHGKPIRLQRHRK